MRTLAFAKRCTKELVRDPLTVLFGLGFPLVLLLLLSAIQANVPVPLFELPFLTPGVTVFGLSFLSLFSATLVAQDRQTAFLQRLYTTPLTPWNFILGYLLPLLPLTLAQSTVCYLVALCLGLPMTIHILFAILMMLPLSVFYVALGLLCGCVFTVKQVGGICGALLTNGSAWLSGVWFDLALVGGAFEKIARLLPFMHMVELERLVLAGHFSEALPHLYPVLGYAVITTLLAMGLFLRQMKQP
ncbi:MAG: ABC transporter permease [Ruminococcaceae bacterium]|nr:ABC transporter permease [Oscillospiraceae bacterium]